LPAEPPSVAKARGLARKSCAEWGISCAELELVTSELVTNAVRNAGGEIELAIITEVERSGGSEPYR
jgi:anti-sigma regulatory factor (Ser/Thr protein kinase)